MSGGAGGSGESPVAPASPVSAIRRRALVRGFVQEALLTWCRQGPRHARVDAVEIEERELVFNERDLVIKH